MKKSQTKTASRANLPAVVVAEVQAPTEHKDWAKRLTAAIKTAARQGNVMLTLVLEARDAGIPVEYVRETIKAAYTATGSSPESARKRASDAVTVYGCTKTADEIPKNLQEAVSAVRKEKAGTQRAPGAPTGDDSEKGSEGITSKKKAASGDLTPLQLIELGIAALQEQSNDLGVLSILGEMLDLASDIASRMAKPVKQAA